MLGSRSSVETLAPKSLRVRTHLEKTLMKDKQEREKYLPPESSLASPQWYLGVFTKTIVCTNPIYKLSIQTNVLYNNLIFEIYFNKTSSITFSTIWDKGFQNHKVL